MLWRRLAVTCALLHLSSAQGPPRTLLQLLRDDGQPADPAAEAAEVAEVAGLLGTEDGVLQLMAHSAHDDGGDTPLHLAAARGWAAVVRLMVAAGADSEVENAARATPLVAVARQAPSGPQLAVVVALLEAGADVNANPQGGYAPLHSCARDGHDELCALLLAAPLVDPDVKASQGQTALHLAAKNGHESTCREYTANALCRRNLELS